MTFEIHQYPYHRVVYRISEVDEVVYIGEGLATRLGTTLTDPRIDPLTKKPQKDPSNGDIIKKYSVLMYDTCGNSTGTAELRYVNVDAVLANALPVPTEMKPGGSHKTLFSTNVENILLALFAWQNGQLPRENGIQGDGENKGGWIADCENTLETYYKLYEDMNLPPKKPWPSRPSALKERAYFKNGKPMEKFLTVWWSKRNPLGLNIGFCSVAGANGTTVPHMAPDMNPIVMYCL